MNKKTLSLLLLLTLMLFVVGCSSENKTPVDSILDTPPQELPTAEDLGVSVEDIEPGQPIIEEVAEIDQITDEESSLGDLI